MVATWMGEVWCHRRALGMGLELRLYNRVSERVCVNPVMRRSVDVRALGSVVRTLCVPFVCVYLVCAEAVCTSRVGSHPFTALSTLVSREGPREIISSPHLVTFCCDFVSGNRIVYVARPLVVS